MSSINLFLLGFIKKKSISAYELAKFINENHLNLMIKISTPAVYKNLVKLKEIGLLSSKNTQTENMPEKTVYSITKKGEEYFNTLITKHANQDFNIHFDFNSFIINLDLVSKKKAIKMLADFKKVLVNKDKEYKKLIKELSNIPVVGQEIIKQLYQTNHTLIKWIEGFTVKYKKTRK